MREAHSAMHFYLPMPEHRASERLTDVHGHVHQTWPYQYLLGSKQPHCRKMKGSATTAASAESGEGFDGRPG